MRPKNRGWRFLRQPLRREINEDIRMGNFELLSLCYIKLSCHAPALQPMQLTISHIYSLSSFLHSARNCPLWSFPQQGLVISFPSSFAKKPSAFSKEQIDILQEWFFDNIENPYPSTEQKQFLSELTGLNVKQIQRWFGNRRKRFL